MLGDFDLNMTGISSFTPSSHDIIASVHSKLCGHVLESGADVGFLVIDDRIADDRESFRLRYQMRAEYIVGAVENPRKFW